MNKKLIWGIIIVLIISALGYWQSTKSVRPDVYNNVPTVENPVATSTIVRTPTKPTVTPKPVINSPQAQFSLSLSTDKQTYTTSEPIVVSLTAHNDSATPAVLNFKTGCQMDYKINGFDSSVSRACTMSLTQVTIPVGGTHTWKETFSQSVYPLALGEQRIVGSLNGYDLFTATNITITN